MVRQSKDCLNRPTTRTIYQGPGNNCAHARLEKGVAEGPRVRNENADLFHQSSRENFERGAKGEIGKSEEATVRSN
jgi:hypothetical protein